MKRFRRQSKNQTYKYLIILILVILFISTIGLKILINASLFVARLSHPNKSAENTLSNENYVLAPEILDLPDATNSAQITFEVRAQKNYDLLVYVNDILQNQEKVQKETFDIEVDLEKGENSIYLKLKDPKSKKEKESETYRIIYKKDKPKLEIESPKDQERTKKEEILITGQTDKYSEIRINGSPVVKNPEGKFSHPLRLVEGENKIRAEAIDIAGNLTSQEMTIFFEKDQ